MKRKKFAPKPKRKMICWLDFILAEGSIPAVVESRNNSGGIYKGGRFVSWDFDGEYFAIWNQAGNAVWCHKDNLKLLSKGTIKSLEQFKEIKVIQDHYKLMRGEIPNCGIRPTYRTGIGA